MKGPTDIMEAELVVIGAIERPFGVKGAIKVRSLSDVSSRFESLDQVVLTSLEGKRVETRVTEVRGGGDRYILSVEALRSPEEAGAFRGGYLYAERWAAANMALPDAPLQCDLIGLSVVDEQGHPVGRLEEVIETAGGHLLVVRSGKREAMVPAVKEFVAQVDLASRQVTIHAIPGLLDDLYEDGKVGAHAW
ncbi:Ribosome maturation factor RimM [Nitrospira tepida]|uniref:Ribosome maturation factor RimM n=1 Tax=Nitrospira tepida TaxID=2973512 RepID=A0AA86N0Y6_9BACT|nr:ribosome maturation factor RimM [Nitrospira tepida]CAI4032738.1 Ribosome maturation factor RimM [Nitrospira tepida]